MSEHTQHLVAEPATTRPVGPSRQVMARVALGTLELLLVATLSMFLVDQVTSASIAALDLTTLLLRPEGVAAVMTIDIALGTAMWMLHRRRTTRSIMAVLGAIAAAFAAPLVPFWFGAVSAMDAVLLGHLLVIPAVAAAVALRARELGPVGHPAAITAAEPGASRRQLERIARRWPTVLALLLTFGKMLDPSIVPAPILILLGVEYLVIGALRRQFRDGRLLALHVLGAIAYTALAALAMVVDPFVAGMLIAAGWILHAGWDAALHRANVVVWRWYAEACAVFDVVVGVTVLVAVLR
ncbi:hypothetical protein [Agromyces sp. NPDC049794]|uniref:hypothetical protein n=1 Tax=unclassified Agromyces TaxID=2639701 RepID=UPI0033DA84F5